MNKLIPSFLFIAIFSISIQSISAVYHANDYYLINVGSTIASAVDADNRTWTSLPATKNVTLIGNTVSSKAIGIKGLDFSDQTPYSTALISDAEFSLVIPVTESGWKFIRLHFYTADYEGFEIKHAKFHVRTGYATLLKNFRPASFGTVDFVLEFSVPVLEAGAIYLDFIPEDAESFAFINGVEVVSHPDIYIGTANKTYVDDGKPFIIDQEHAFNNGKPLVIGDQTALENIARVNVGDEEISVVDDSGLYRFWDSDLNNWLTGETGFQVDAAEYNTSVSYPPGFQDAIAPSSVYQTARSIFADFSKKAPRMTWNFPVDAEAEDYFMVRLHFCEVMGNIVDKVNQRVFDIYINDELVESGVDLIALTGKPGTPVYKDYVVSAKQEIVVGTGPDLSSHTQQYDTLLNGVEVFRVIVMTKLLK